MLVRQDLFFLQRHQMLVHHEKELDHLKRMMERKEEELVKNQVGSVMSGHDLVFKKAFIMASVFEVYVTLKIC